MADAAAAAYEVVYSGLVLFLLKLSLFFLVKMQIR